MDSEKILAIRHYLGMNQSQFAEFLSVSPSAIGRIENGDLRVSDRIRGKLALRFNFNDEFFSYYENFLRTLEKHN